MGDLDDNAIPIKQISHIKFLLIIMFHQTSNLRYFKYIRITSCIGLEPFLLTINLDVMSSFNVFSSLIYVFRYKCFTIFN